MALVQWWSGFVLSLTSPIVSSIELRFNGITKILIELDLGLTPSSANLFRHGQRVYDCPFRMCALEALYSRTSQMPFRLLGPDGSFAN